MLRLSNVPDLPAPPQLSTPFINCVSQGPATLASKRVKPTQADIKTGPSGVPFWGTETVREDKALSKALHHKTVTEVGATAACTWQL
jgi:hypothetical protein